MIIGSLESSILPNSYPMGIFPLVMGVLIALGWIEFDVVWLGIPKFFFFFSSFSFLILSSYSFFFISYSFINLSSS
jgi:hypothetical protein